MERKNKGPIADEDWNFDGLLKGASEYEVSFCRLYEYAREVFDIEWFKENRRITGFLQSEMMLKHPELFTPFFWFCVLYDDLIEDGEFVSNPGWLSVPYFKLSKKFRSRVLSQRDLYLGSSYVGSHIEFAPAYFIDLTAPKIDIGGTIHCEIPVGPDSVMREYFEAFLKRRDGRYQKAEGANTPMRKMKSDLRYLGALRLLREMTVKEASAMTKDILKRRLYSNPSGWSLAKKEAQKLIKRFESEIRPIKEAFDSAPEMITSLQHNSGTGEISYS